MGRSPARADVIRYGSTRGGNPLFRKGDKAQPARALHGTTYGALGANHLFAGDTDRAINLLRRARTELPRMWWICLALAGALGLKGDVDEARAEIAEALKLKPEVNSIARWRAIGPTLGLGDPRLQALMEKTVYAGLRCAGIAWGRACCWSRSDR